MSTSGSSTDDGLQPEINQGATGNSTSGERPSTIHPPPPEQIGPYRISQQLGAGGMGTVYLGTHQETGDQAAIKLLPPALAREPGFVIRFNREIDAMRLLKSPNIVELYDAGEWEGTYYYAMEYVAGETLSSKLLREKRIPWQRVIEISIEICTALKAAHNAGVIHRDLKPSNLMLTEAGAVKLTDFGVAQVFASSKLTITGGVIGTAEYMSPEQAQGKRTVKQSDIYSLGAVMYVMLSGRPPFVGKTALDVAQKHKYGTFDSPRRIVPEIPHWLDEVVCQCLEKRIEDRYPDAHVLGLRLAEIPKKLELAGKSATFELDGAGGDEVTQAADAKHDKGQVGGTFMRDLVRAHVTNPQNQTVIERLFDSTLTLVGLLVLVILGGVVWYQSRTPDAQNLYDQGKLLMGKPPGPAWTEANRKCFEPLLSIDRETWGERVTPFQQNISLYNSLVELKKELSGTRTVKVDRFPESEPERLLAKIRRQVLEGDTSAARRSLTALADLFKIDAALVSLDKLANEIIELLPEQDTSWLNVRLERAQQLRADGELQAAETLLKTLRQLYHDEPDVLAKIDQVGPPELPQVLQIETPKSDEPFKFIGGEAQ